MLIVLTGGTGLIGQALQKQLSSKNYKIHLLGRKAPNNLPPSCKFFLWSDVQSDIPLSAFPTDEDYGVIHLLGEPVASFPWTSRLKNKIYNSRVKGTKKLLDTVKNLPRTPQFFLSASAIGIYGEPDQPVTEESPISNQNLFLQKVCKDWEEEALKMSSTIRSLIFRLGVVMSYEKGFLYEQTKWLKRGFYPSIISRKTNWLSWISLEDLCRMIIWAIENKQAKGIYNAVSPNPLPLKKFYHLLVQQNKFKSFPLPSPLFLMKLAGGEMTKNLLASCQALPKKALDQGFTFKQAQLEQALKTDPINWKGCQ